MSGVPDRPKRPRRPSVATVLFSAAMVVLAARIAWLVHDFEITNAELERLQQQSAAWHWETFLMLQAEYWLCCYGPPTALGLFGLSLFLRSRRR